MEVWLRPLIDEGQITATGPKGAWRGTIQPAEPATYFQSYDAMLQYYAAIPGATWLVIGSELNSLESPEYSAQWQDMIAHLRQTSGDTGPLLTYAQNWDTGMYNGYPDWLSLLDGAAIDAYFPIEGADNQSTPNQITEGLAHWQDQMMELKSKVPSHKLFITEAGLS